MSVCRTHVGMSGPRNSGNAPRAHWNALQVLGVRRTQPVMRCTVPVMGRAGLAVRCTVPVMSRTALGMSGARVRSIARGDRPTPRNGYRSGQARQTGVRHTSFIKPRYVSCEAMGCASEAGAPLVSGFVEEKRWVNL